MLQKSVHANNSQFSYVSPFTFEVNDNNSISNEKYSEGKKVHSKLGFAETNGIFLNTGITAQQNWVVLLPLLHTIGAIAIFLLSSSTFPLQSYSATMGSYST